MKPHTYKGIMHNPNKWQDHHLVAPPIAGKTIKSCEYVSDTEMKIVFADGDSISIASAGYDEHELHWTEE